MFPPSDHEKKKKGQKRGEVREVSHLGRWRGEKETQPLVPLCLSKKGGEKIKQGRRTDLSARRKEEKRGSRPFYPPLC